MKFEDALKALREGKKITCLSLGCEITLNDMGTLYVMSREITFDDGDLLNQIIFGEWHFVEEPGKTFPEVFEAFKKGKKIRRKSWVNEHSYRIIASDEDYISCLDLGADDWIMCDE